VLVADGIADMRQYPRKKYPVVVGTNAPTISASDVAVKVFWAHLLSKLPLAYLMFVDGIDVNMVSLVVMLLPTVPPSKFSDTVPQAVGMTVPVADKVPSPEREAEPRLVSFPEAVKDVSDDKEAVPLCTVTEDTI